jgi:hypothetical protein
MQNQCEKDFQQLYYLAQCKPENDTERIPTTEKGDKYILLGTVIGMAVGGMASGIFGYCVNLNFLIIVMAVLWGLDIGGIIGGITGNFFKRRALKRAIENMQFLNKIDEL